MANLIESYDNSGLSSFLEQRLFAQYNTLAALCVEAAHQTEKLYKLESGKSTSQYTTLCSNIIADAEQYLASRNTKYVPYVQNLADKVIAGHNCGTCSGGCKLNHDMHLVEIKASNEMMQKTLSKLQIVSLPLYADTLFPEEYRVLRNQMALLENNLTELFFLENNYLVPKIQEAQKSINANNY